MFLQLAAALAGLLATVLILVVHKIVTNRLSLLRFKKLAKGIPVGDECRWLGNHLLSMSFGENCLIAQAAHERLGPYVGGLLGNKFVVSITDLDLAKRVVLDEVQLDRGSLNMPMDEFEHSIMLVPGSQWRNQRRVFAPALKSNKFKAPNVMHEIQESISKLIGHIERRLDDASRGSGTTTFEVDDIAHKYSLNLVLSCFYKQNNLVDFNNPHDKWTGLLDGIIMSSQSWPLKLSMLFPWFTRPLDWLTWHFHEIGTTRRQMVDFVRTQTKLGMEARKRAEELAARGELRDKSNFVLRDGTRFRRNLVDSIIDGFLDGKLTWREYFNSSCFLLVAADKTAADCIVFTLYQLSIRPDVQEQLRKSVVVDGAESTYLGWVLNESLRLMPPAPVGCTRTVDHKIELQDGKVIPQGTLLVMNAYVIHRLKKYWGEDADEFRPDRWADTSHHHPMQFIPFGAGPRGCLGREFALFTMKSLLAALLIRYKFEGQPREDAHKFHAPSLVFLIPNSPTFATIKRVSRP